MRAKRKWVGDAREIGATGENAAAPTPKKDGAPVPGSPGLQAISFNTSCEIEIASTPMQAAGQLRKRRIGADSRPSGSHFALQRMGFQVRPDRFMLNVCAPGAI
jgi:hypothetical protein